MTTIKELPNWYRIFPVAGGFGNYLPVDQGEADD
jgi:hypothetical protein